MAEGPTPPSKLCLGDDNDREWKVFKQKFELYLLATEKNRKPEDVKVALLLTCAGDELLAVYNSLDLATASDPTLNTVLGELDKYFAQRKNELAARYKFRKCMQRPGESLDSFITRLRTLVQDCEYADQAEKELRDQIVFGCIEDTLCQKFFDAEDLTLKRTVDLCVTHQATKQQMSIFKQEHTEPMLRGNETQPMKYGRQGEDKAMNLRECRIRPVIRNFDSSSDSSPSAVQAKQSRPVTLPEAPGLEDLEALSEAPTDTQHSSTPTEIDQALRPVLLAVAKCETRIEEQQKILNEVLSIVQNLQQQQCQVSAMTTVYDNSVLDEFLPLKTYEDLTLFEEQLTIDSDLKLALEHRLHLLGGKTLRAAVKYMIDCCMTNGLQHQYNWEGRVGWKTKTNMCKKGFKNTQLCELMMGILLNKESLKTDEAEVRKAMMMYLRNAADRCHGRQRRSDRRASSPSSYGQDLDP